MLSIIVALKVSDDWHDFIFTYHDILTHPVKFSSSHLSGRELCCTYTVCTLYYASSQFVQQPHWFLCNVFVQRGPKVPQMLEPLKVRPLLLRVFSGRIARAVTEMVADLKGVIDVSIIRQCWKKVTSSVSQRDLSGYSPEEWCCLLTRTHGGNAKRRARSPTECGCAAYESYSLYVWMIMNDSCCCWLVNDGLLSRMNWRKRSN